MQEASPGSGFGLRSGLGLRLASALRQPYQEPCVVLLHPSAAVTIKVGNHGNNKNNDYHDHIESQSLENFSELGVISLCHPSKYNKQCCDNADHDLTDGVSQDPTSSSLEFRVSSFQVKIVKPQLNRGNVQSVYIGLSPDREGDVIGEGTDRSDQPG